jgi:hypothetical protein
VVSATNSHGRLYLFMVFLMCQPTEQNKSILFISIRVLCGNIATCFDPAESSSGNHSTNISLVIGLFNDTDRDQCFISFFLSVCV